MWRWEKQKAKKQKDYLHPEVGGKKKKKKTARNRPHQKRDTVKLQAVCEGKKAFGEEVLRTLSLGGAAGFYRLFIRGGTGERGGLILRAAQRLSIYKQELKNHEITSHQGRGPEITRGGICSERWKK